MEANVFAVKLRDRGLVYIGIKRGHLLYRDFCWRSLFLEANKSPNKESTSIGEDPCSDFTFWSKPDRSCKICRREFYGETCFANHLIQYETVDKELKKMKEELEQNLDE